MRSWELSVVDTVSYEELQGLYHGGYKRLLFGVIELYVCMKRYGATRTCASALAWGEADGVDCQRLCVVTDEW